MDEKPGSTDTEMRYAPEDRESISGESLYFVDEYMSIIKITARAVVTSLVGFINWGDGGFGEEGRMFVSGGAGLRFIHRATNCRPLWS